MKLNSHSIFYKFPKEVLIAVFHWFNKKHKHLKYLVFDNLFPDLVYYTKSYDKTRPLNLLRDYHVAHEDNYKVGLINPMQLRHMEGFIQTVRERIKQGGIQTVVDIGCANGYIISLLAKEFPGVKFYGIDFKVPAAGVESVTFIEGYPLDQLASIKKIDMVMGTSTFFFMTPAELGEYMKEFKRLHVQHVAIFDTQIHGYEQKNDGAVWSKHMGYNFAWCHNYSGYLKKFGYKVTEFHRIKSDHPGRNDHYLLTVMAEASGASTAGL